MVLTCAIIPARTPSDKSAHVEGLETWLVSPEDLILLKLIAGRPRDYGDIGDIFFVQSQLDESYLRRWAEPLGITDRLEKALRDAQEQTQ